MDNSQWTWVYNGQLQWTNSSLGQTSLVHLSIATYYNNYPHVLLCVKAAVFLSNQPQVCSALSDVGCLLRTFASDSQTSNKKLVNTLIFSFPKLTTTTTTSSTRETDLYDHQMVEGGTLCHLRTGRRRDHRIGNDVGARSPGPNPKR